MSIVQSAILSVCPSNIYYHIQIPEAGFIEIRTGKTPTESYYWPMITSSRISSTLSTACRALLLPAVCEVVVQ